MKRRLIFLSILIFPLYVHSGEIDWNRASFGMTANYQMPLGDFGNYWKNSPALGPLGRYEIMKRVYLMGTLTVSYYAPVNDTGGKNIPHIWLLNISGGIHYEIPISSWLSGLIGIGGDNFTFIFRGDAADDIGSNLIESEVALHAETGLRLQFNRMPRFDIYTRYTSIFSFPDQIPIWLNGVYVYF